MPLLWEGQFPGEPVAVMAESAPGGCAVAESAYIAGDAGFRAVWAMAPPQPLVENSAEKVGAGAGRARACP